MESSAPRKLWQPLLVAAAVLFAYWSVLLRLGRFWWEDENYSHGLLIPSSSAISSGSNASGWQA